MAQKGNEMISDKCTLADLLPAQQHYYLLYDGDKYARHGTENANGLLVFLSFESAEQFRLTIGIGLPAFKTVRSDAINVLQLIEDAGAVCVAEGLSVRVGTLNKQQ